MTKIKKLIGPAIKTIFAIGLIYWLISSGKINFLSLKNLLSPAPLMIGTGLILINFFLVSERWRILIHSQNISSGFWESFKLTMIGLFFNFAMPGGVGGDIIKGYYFAKDHPQSRMIAATSVLFDRILGLYAMILMGFFAMMSDFHQIKQSSIMLSLFYAISALTFFYGLALALIFSQRIHQSQWIQKILYRLPKSHRLISIYNTVHLYGSNKQSVLKTLIISFIAQCSSIFFLYYCGLQMDSANPPTLSNIFIVAPIGFIATAIPISPAGVGVGQAAFYFLYNKISRTESDMGANLATAFQAFQFMVGMIGAVIYLRRKDKISEKSLTEIQESQS